MAELLLNIDTGSQNRVEEKNASRIDHLTLVPNPALQGRMEREKLEQALAYFYANGGPVLEEKDGVIMSSIATISHNKPRNTKKQAKQTVALLTPEGPKKVSIDYLNERLAYFYSHGGPVMDI
jgi:hypothetical protein